MLIQKDLENGQLINLKNFTKDEQKIIKSFQLLSSKPMFFIGNINDSEQSKEYIEQLSEVAKELNTFVIPASIKIEHEISTLEEEEKKEYLEVMGLDEPILNKIILESYKMLGLKTFFTAGPNEIRAWTIKDGFTAPNAAGVILSLIHI